MMINASANAKLLARQKTVDDGGEDMRVDSRYMDINGLSKGARVAVEAGTVGW